MFSFLEFFGFVLGGGTLIMKVEVGNVLGVRDFTWGSLSWLFGR